MPLKMYLGSVQIGGGSSVYVGETPPATPADGDLWGVLKKGKTIAFGTGGSPYFSSWDNRYFEEGPVPSGLTRGFACTEASGLGIAVIGGQSGNVFTSPAGQVWNSYKVTGPNQEINAVVWAASLSLIVAVSSDGYAITSSDGINWTATTLPGTGNLMSIAWSPTLGMLVAVGSRGTFYSTNGSTWTSTTSPSGGFTAVTWCAGLGMFVAGGYQTLYTSTNGSTWTSRTIGTTLSQIRTIVWSPTYATIVAAGDTTTGANTSVMVSTNGTSWTARIVETGSRRSIYGSVWVENIGEFALSSDGAGIYYSIGSVAVWSRVPVWPPGTAGSITAIGYLPTFTGEVRLRKYDAANSAWVFLDAS